MNSYQDMILDKLVSISRQEPLHPRRTVSTSFLFANRGRLIVTRDASFATIATADFDFQADRALVLLNNPGGPRSMMSAPLESTFVWTVGDRTDDAIVTRLFSEWHRLVQEGLS